MSTRTALKVLFGCIFLTMLVYTGYASTRQPILAWTGLGQGEDRFWTTATLLDAYCGFLTFYVWVHYKERRALVRLGWFVAIMLLGNMAMSAYVLRQLMRQRADEPLSQLLVARNP